jgi:hypothetical protein
MTAPEPLLDLATYQALASGEGLEQLRLSAIIRDIRDYCGWHIAPTMDATITVDGSNAKVFQLPTLRLNSVTSVTENGTELVDDADYRWSADGSLIRAHRWTGRYRGVVAVVNHGYDQVPESITSVILDATGTALAVPVGEAVAASVGETMGPFSFERPDFKVEFTAAQRRVLDHYRIPGPP